VYIYRPFKETWFADVITA